MYFMIICDPKSIATDFRAFTTNLLTLDLQVSTDQDNFMASEANE